MNSGSKLPEQLPPVARELAGIQGLIQNRRFLANLKRLHHEVPGAHRRECKALAELLEAFGPSSNILVKTSQKRFRELVFLTKKSFLLARLMMHGRFRSGGNGGQKIKLEDREIPATRLGDLLVDGRYWKIYQTEEDIGDSGLHKMVSYYLQHGQEAPVYISREWAHSDKLELPF